MIQQSPQTGEILLSSLLESAELRRRQGGPTADFSRCLLSEVVESGLAGGVQLWELAADQPRLLGSEGTLHPPDHECLKTAPTGAVQRTESETGAEDRIFRFCCAAEVCHSIRIVLELQAYGPVIDRQLVPDLCEVFSDLMRRQLLESLSQKIRFVRSTDLLVTLVHLARDERHLANCLASDLPELLQCRRISTVRRVSAHRWELSASTGVAQPDPRSDASRRICQFVESKAAAESATGSTPRAVSAGASETTASRSHDEEDLAESTMIGGREPAADRPDDDDALVRIVPLSESGRFSDARWAVVFEFLQAQRDAGVTQALETLRRHAAIAFRNLERAQHRGLAGRIRSGVRSLGTGRTLVMATVVASLLAALALWKTELRIEVDGILVPAARSYVFAPEKGILTELFVEDGSAVTVGSVMCRQQNEELEIQRESVEGELTSSQARLAALESTRGDRGSSQNTLLSAEKEELKQRIVSQQKQLEIIDRRLNQLNITAPMDGRIYGDRIRELLLGRPVERGQYLFEVADPSGEWQLELRIPESEIRHVLLAREQQSEPLTISYTLETRPGETRTAGLTRLSEATEYDAAGKLSTTAMVAVDLPDGRDLRPGAGVAARIHCGSRRSGFVLFRRFIEAIQRRWWI